MGGLCLHLRAWQNGEGGLVKGRNYLYYGHEEYKRKGGKAEKDIRRTVEGSWARFGISGDLLRRSDEREAIPVYSTISCLFLVDLKLCELDFTIYCLFVTPCYLLLVCELGASFCCGLLDPVGVIEIDDIISEFT